VESLETALKARRRRRSRDRGQAVGPDRVTARDRSAGQSLQDEDPVIRRAAARGLAEIQWQAPADETGVRYYAALREWRRCAECGEAALPTLLSSFGHVDPLEQSDIIAALVQLKWKPTEADSMTGYFWAAQGRWDKCTELGEPAVEALDGILRSAPSGAIEPGQAATLAGMDQPRSALSRTSTSCSGRWPFSTARAPTRTSAVFSKP